MAVLNGHQLACSSSKPCVSAGQICHLFSVTCLCQLSSFGEQAWGFAIRLDSAYREHHDAVGAGLDTTQAPISPLSDGFHNERHNADGESADSSFGYLGPLASDHLPHPHGRASRTRSSFSTRHHVPISPIARNDSVGYFGDNLGPCQKSPRGA